MWVVFPFRAKPCPILAAHKCVFLSDWHVLLVYEFFLIG